MVYETVENGTQYYEKEGGMVGAGSKPVIDETESLTSNSKFNTNILTTGATYDALALDKRTGLKLHADVVRQNRERTF